MTGVSACSVQHREEEMDTGYINASHLKSPDEERPDWQYVVGQVILNQGTPQKPQDCWPYHCLAYSRYLGKHR